MKVKSENGSMTIYVSVVLLTMLLILTALFLTSNSVRESQIQTIIKIKEAYEADNSRAPEIYEKVVSDLEEKYVYEENFDAEQTYATNRTEYTINNGIITLTNTGSDPQLHMYYVTSFSPLEYRYVDVRYRVTANVSSTVMEFFMIENPRKSNILS